MLAIQHLHVVGDDLGEILGLAFFLVAIGLDPAFEIDQLTLGEQLEQGYAKTLLSLRPT